MAIRCVVVTPERTEIDREASYVTLPMYDGELGVAAGRAPLIGRLGYGLLKLQTETGTQQLFIDGGFAQVENDVVSVLTSRAIPAEQIDAAAAERSLSEALAMPGNTPELRYIRDAAQLRARGQLRAARAPH
ncbi:ATP synthase F1 subunit epsilon [Candidatus Laterigemmans baculatus]|uniref:ATP synthase F1 subunit epsilon n=1 Tax=Candidatus Laterigemmans baculatus TaxID=2770505 RepID=UPI0013DC950D|nr:ATP synthase F1 subunit epsilon [Candidatus Laterigemmans baculatus]